MKSNNSKRLITIIAVVIVIIIAVAIVSQQKKSNVNSGKGAGNPTTVAEAWVKCLDSRDASYLNDYLDEQYDNDKVISETKETIQKLIEKGFGNINIGNVKYDSGDEYLENGTTYVMVKVKFGEIGLWTILSGQNAFSKEDETYNLYLHKADTPQGEKWFLGR